MTSLTIELMRSTFLKEQKGHSILSPGPWLGICTFVGIFIFLSSCRNFPILKIPVTLLTVSLILILSCCHIYLYCKITLCNHATFQEKFFAILLQATAVRYSLSLTLMVIRLCALDNLSNDYYNYYRNRGDSTDGCSNNR